MDDELTTVLKAETLNAYSSVGDFSEVSAKLQQFHRRKKTKPDPEG